jgi:hypothetical protein
LYNSILHSILGVAGASLRGPTRAVWLSDSGFAWAFGLRLSAPVSASKVNVSIDASLHVVYIDGVAM